MQPPNLFDEAVRRFDRFGDESFASEHAEADAGSPKTFVFAVHVDDQAEDSPKSPRKPADPHRAGAGGASPVEADLGFRKAHFFADCLKADRSLESFKLPPAAADATPRPPTREKERRRASVDRFKSNDSALSCGSFAAGSIGGLDRSMLPSLQQSMGGYVSSCKQAKVRPNTIGIIRSSDEQLQLEYGCMSDVRAETMLQSLKASSSGVREASLRSNGLTSRGAQHILDALPDSVESIDLSQNDLSLGDAWCESLTRLAGLRQFTVSDCQLGDNACKALCAGLSGCTQLSLLNLSGNNIHHTGGAIGSLLRMRKTMTELDLHWNHLTGDSAREMVRGLNENSQAGGLLQRLDLSWNPLGKIGGEETCAQMAELFRNTQALIHVDISKCDLSVEHCQILAEGLKENHSILGIHVTGNAAKMTPQGFMDPVQVVDTSTQARPSKEASAATRKAEPKAKGKAKAKAKEAKPAAKAKAKAAPAAAEIPVGGPAAAAKAEASEKDGAEKNEGDVGHINRSTSAAQQAGSCCWICERWREVRLSYAPGISGPAADSVWVFTSIDGFKHPTKMVQCGAEFVSYLMAPAGHLHFIFQAGTEVLPSRTAPLIREFTPPGAPPLRVQRVGLRSEPAAGEEEPSPEQGSRPGPAGDPLGVEVQSVNGTEVAMRGPDEPVCSSFIPRQAALRGDHSAPSAWEVERSLFAPYEEAFVRRNFCERCFEEDWRLSGADQLLRADRAHEVRRLLRAHYAQVIVLHSSLCSAAAAWEPAAAAPLIFGMGIHEYTHMLVQHNLIGEDCSLEEADALFVLAAAPGKESASWSRVAQTRGILLLRHSFLQVLVRLALCWHTNAAGAIGRERTSSKASSIAEAMEYLLNKHIMYPSPPMKNNFKAVQWRADVLHTEAVETVLRQHLRNVLDPLFSAYAGRGASSGQRMRPEGWFALLDALEVLPCRGANNQVALWDRVWLWEVSAMPHVDQVTTTEHLELTFVEYLEALARLVALLRSRERVAKAAAGEAEKWDYGLGAPAAAAIFCADKDGVIEPKVFAGHLGAFLRSARVRRAVSAAPAPAPAPR